ncbi:Cytokinesis protein sepH [Leucoagaricus sp. SymC.cos]|nr:Cytokinesis protein sepH [Leucoagaricus sp. SymC.cos]
MKTSSSSTTSSSAVNKGSRQRNINIIPPIPSSSRSPPRTSVSSPPLVQDAPSAFNRLASLGQSIRTVTRSRKAPAPEADDFATVTAKTAKGKEKAKEKASVTTEEKMNVFGKLGSKVTFRRTRRESLTQSPVPPSTTQEISTNRARAMGSLRGASISSPALHLSSQALPSPKSQPSVPASSSSGATAGSVSPTRTRRISLQPEISPPGPLASRRERHPAASGQPTRHRATKSNPPDLTLSTTPSTPQRNPSRTRDTQLTTSPRPTSPVDYRTESPTQAPIRRATSPHQKSYAQNRHYNISSTSLISPSSPTSPSSPSSYNPEFREQMRRAASMVCKEMIRPPPHMSNKSETWIEVERRMQGLVRLERIWGMSSSASNLNIGNSGSAAGGSGSGMGLSAAGEERERRVFCDALRDGYVLCQLMNKLRSRNVVRPDPREDGLSKTTNKNITRFLAACASYGLQNEDLFLSEDLIDPLPSSEAAAKVAHTVITLVGFVETPAPSRSTAASPTRSGTAAQGSSSSGTAGSGPYMKGSVGRAAASVPNLNTPKSTSPTPTSPLSSKMRPGGRRYSPPSGLPPLRSDYSEEMRMMNMTEEEEEETGHEEEDEDEGEVVEMKTKPIPVPRILDPPPRPPAKSPLRAQSVKRNHNNASGRVQDDGGISAWARNAASPPPTMTTKTSSPPIPTAASVPPLPSSEYYSYARQSVASTAVTDTTVITQVSSILDNIAHSPIGGGSGSGGGAGKFGTIRTMTTDLTSEMPSPSSIGRKEGIDVAEELGVVKDVFGVVQSPPVPPPKMLRERRGSANHTAHTIDLTRVAEEPDECSSSVGHRKVGEGTRKAVEKQGDKIHHAAVHLHKAKWPDDFLDVFQMQMRNPSPTSSSIDPEEHHPTSSIAPLPIPIRGSSPARTSSFHHHHVNNANTPMTRSVSPPKKLAIVGRRPDEPGSSSLAPRRPSHLSRHSVDTPLGLPSSAGSTSTLLSASPGGGGTASGLLPKESILRRDASPDGVRPSSATGNRVMIRRTNANKSSNGGGPLPPLGSPRAGSSLSMARNTAGTPDSERSAANTNVTATGVDVNDKPRLVRGRFQSEINGSSRVKQRPNSFDELGAKQSRTRFESMVNLGRADSALASASDLMARDSMDGSAVRKTLVVKEEGKPPTHFQLGNCIGKGQFGSVYRALNLNTGQMVAVKRIRLEGLKEDEISTLMREVDLVRSLSHPSIVKYEGMARDEDTLSIVLEYAENGSLAHTLKAFGKLNEKLVASYVVKILEGLHYLHQSDVVHCDLKAANILTTKNGNVKLSDFGVSLNLRAMERQTQNDVAGTPNWMAPEVIELKGASPKSDIWSLGCTVVELLTGRPPYADITNTMSVMFRIVENDMPPIPEGCSEMLQDFLHQCFNKEPSERPSAEILCEHPWLKINWVALKDLRPQDSIPFLRRVSADIQKSDMVRYLAKLDFPDSPTASEFPFARDLTGSTPPVSPSSPVGRRTSNTSIRPPPKDSEHMSSDHSFVKTTFSKPVVCRVCLENVKKAAVLCAKCSLISHSKCAPNAPPTCDLRSQLLLYAQYAEQGNPNSLYSNPLLEHPEIPRAPAAMSDVPFIAHHTPRTSVDTPVPPQQPTHQPTHHSTPSHPGSPPTAFRIMAAFKRSRSNLAQDFHAASSAPASEADLSNSRTASKDAISADKPSDLHFDNRMPVPRKRPTGVLQKRSKERPRSYTSNSTGLSSLRSAATAAESLNSNGPTETGRLSQLSSAGNAGTSSSQERKSGAFAKMKERGKKKSIPVKVPAVPSSAVTSDVETTDFAELSTASSVLPGSFSLARKTRRDSKQQGNCIVQ